MATYLLTILAALAVVMIIIVLGLILTKILINRADKAQTQANILTEQSQGVFIDIDDLPGVEQQSGIAVISNDIMKDIPHRHLTKKTVSVINQDAPIDRINDKNTTRQIHTYKSLTIPAKTDTTMISSETSRVNPVTDKITLDY